MHTSTPARVPTHSHRRHSLPACTSKSWPSALSIAALVRTASPKAPRPPGRTQASGLPADGHRREAQVVARPPGDPSDVTAAGLVERHRVRVRGAGSAPPPRPRRPGRPPCRSSRRTRTGTGSSASTCTSGRPRTPGRRSEPEGPPEPVTARTSAHPSARRIAFFRRHTPPLERTGRPVGSPIVTATARTGRPVGSAGASASRARRSRDSAGRRRRARAIAPTLVGNPAPRERRRAARPAIAVRNSSSSSGGVDLGDHVRRLAAPVAVGVPHAGRHRHDLAGRRSAASACRPGARAGPPAPRSAPPWRTGCAASRRRPGRPTSHAQVARRCPGCG